MGDATGTTNLDDAPVDFVVTEKAAKRPERDEMTDVAHVDPHHAV